MAKNMTLCGDVSVTLRTASRFAQALKMDFIPVLTPQGEEASSPAPAIG